MEERRAMTTTRIVGLAIVILLAAGVCGTAAGKQMDINEVGNVTAGETVTTSGTTNIAPGNHLTVTVTPVGFGTTNKSEPGGATGTSGTAIVQKGNATANTWAFEADTTGFEPGEYTVIVEWVEGDASASTTFMVSEAAPVTTATTAPLATTAPVTTTAPATSPTPTAAGPALPVVAAMAACALAGYLMRRR